MILIMNGKDGCRNGFVGPKEELFVEMLCMLSSIKNDPGLNIMFELAKSMIEVKGPMEFDNYDLTDKEKEGVADLKEEFNKLLNLSDGDDGFYDA